MSPPVRTWPGRTWLGRTWSGTLRVTGGAVLASGLVVAHDPTAVGPGLGLRFGVVVGLTVAVGVLGGAVVVRWRRSRDGGRPTLPVPGVPFLLLLLGCWAGLLAVKGDPVVAVPGLVAGGALTWSLRDHVAGGHRGCEEAALGAVLLHRVVEGAFLATLYAADAALGVGAAVVLAGHAAAETGAVAGLQSSARRGWGAVAVVQAAFVAGALAGTVVAGPVPALVHVSVLGLLAGALLAAGVATGTRPGHPHPPAHA